MRTAKVGKYTYRLSERDYRALLARFDLNNVAVLEDGKPSLRYYIPALCICENHKGGCRRCPLKRSEHRGASCVDLLYNTVLDSRPTPHFSLDTAGISWPECWDHEARQEIQQVHTFLLQAGGELA